MKESQNQPIITPKTSHHTFRNIMLLILFALAIWSWFHYLPQHAMNTLTNLNDRAGAQINEWMGIETIPDTDYSLLLPPQVVAPTIVSGSTMSGETNTGISQTGSIINAGRTAQTETGNTQTGNNQTEPSVRDEIDTTTSKNDLIAADTGSTQNLPSTTLSSVMSISIGGQTITLDGTPDEDIVINGNGYTVTIQKN